jgi:hypothetical protein
MGVKGLTAALKRLGVPDKEELLAGTTLIVDGDGWAFEVLGMCEDGAGVLYGGDYLRIDEAVRQEVDFLRSFGLHLVFYCGGGSDSFKDATSVKRTLQREELWMNLYTCCRGTNEQAKCQLPLPTMAIDQVWRTLADMQMNIVECNEESDQIIAKAVFDLNEKHGSNTHYCYGRDR